MTYIMTGIEADGSILGDYSMVCFGAILVEPLLDRNPVDDAKGNTATLLQFKEQYGLKIGLK